VTERLYWRLQRWHAQSHFIGCLFGGGRRSIKSAFAVAENVRLRVGGVMGSAGEKGDGGTASREDRNGAAVTLIFAGIFPEIM